MNRKFVLAVDFDGTITERDTYPHMGELRIGCALVLKRLHKLGAYIVVWTCRHREDAEIMKYLDHHGIPYDNINENPYFNTGSPKIVADAYYDDRNVGAPMSWAKAEEYILKQMLTEGFVSEEDIYRVKSEKRRVRTPAVKP